MPAIREERLPPDTRALVWVLVDPAGAVADATLQATSGNRVFDDAATRAARGLRYRPALREGAPVPVWVLAEISMLLR